MLPGLSGRRFFRPSLRDVAFFDSSVGGNLTPDSARADRLQGATDGLCLLSSQTSPGKPERLEMRALSAQDEADCDQERLARRLDEWRRQQAGQRLETLQQGAAADAPSTEAVDEYAEAFTVLAPTAEEALVWETTGGLLALGWDAQEPVWVEYHVGDGVLAVRGAFKVDQPGGIAFGPFPEGFWNDLAGYSPFRFRVLDEAAETRSEWTQFSLQRVTAGP